MSDSVDLIEVNEESFESEVLASTIPVVVEFGAAWCGPCKKQLPVLAAFSNDNPDVKVVKIDIDQNRDLANKYSIRSVPTIILFSDGNRIRSSVGLMTQEKLKSFVYGD